MKIIIIFLCGVLCLSCAGRDVKQQTIIQKEGTIINNENNNESNKSQNSSTNNDKNNYDRDDYFREKENLNELRKLYAKMYKCVIYDIKPDGSVSFVGFESIPRCLNDINNELKEKERDINFKKEKANIK
jgi:hypothetical protein